MIGAFIFTQEHSLAFWFTGLDAAYFYTIGWLVQLAVMKWMPETFDLIVGGVL